MSESTAPSFEDLLAWLVAYAAAELGQEPDGIDVDQPLNDLGLDSLDVIDMVLSVEDQHDVALNSSDRGADMTLASLASWLLRPPPVLGTAPGGPRGAVGAGPSSSERVGEGDHDPHPAPVFILSAPRSGSTLLRVMLAGHPQQFAPPELNLLPFRTMRERRDLLPPRRFDEGLQRALMELESLDATSARERIDAMVAADLPVRQVYARLQHLAGSRALVDKSPINALVPAALGRAENEFESSRYLLLTRHPNAAVASGLRHRFDLLYHDFARVLPADPPGGQELAEWAWRTAAANGRQLLALVGSERGLHIRFEDLVREPRRTMEAICAFLDLEFDEAVLHPYRGARMTDGVRPGEAALGDQDFGTHDGIDPERAEAWRRSLPEAPFGRRTRRAALDLGYSLDPDVAAEPPTGMVRSSGALNWQPLVAMREGSAGPPLFLVHPAGGVLYPYFELVDALGGERPIYGLHEPAGHGAPAPRASVDEYAADYVDAVRIRQPHGPYLLVGWSFGGHVAIAMGKRLLEAGEDVAAVVLLDCEAPVDRRTLSATQRLRQYINWARILGSGGRDLVSMARETASVLRAAGRDAGPREERPGRFETLRWALYDAGRRQLARDGSRIGGVMARQPQLERVRVARETIPAMSRRIHYHFNLLARQQASSYPGDVVLVRARDQHLRSFWTSDALGWERLVEGRLEVRPVDGNHLTLGRAPNVQQVAAAVHEALEAS